LQKKCNGLLSPSSCQATVLLTIRLSTRLPFSMRPIHVSPKSHMVRFSFRRMLVAPSPPVQPDVCVNFCVRAGNGLADSTSNGGSTGFWTRSIGSKMRQTHICHSTEDEVRRTIPESAHHDRLCAGGPTRRATLPRPVFPANGKWSRPCSPAFADRFSDKLRS